MSILVVCKKFYSEAKAIYEDETFTQVVANGQLAIEVNTNEERDALLALGKAKENLIKARQLYIDKFEEALKTFHDNHFPL